MLFRSIIAITGISLLMTAGSMGSVMAGETVLPEPIAEEERSQRQVFQVTFPSDTEHVFDFIMDPQKLISQTDAAAYGGSSFEEDATLFFRRTDGNVAEDYSSSSDALVITNRGTADVDIVLTADVSLDSAAGIVMTDDREFTDDTDAGLYLALTDGEHTVAIDGEKGASIRTMLRGAAGENETYSEYRFWLTGAVNEKGDWSAVTGGVPEVTVTWRAVPREAAAPEDPVAEGDRLSDDTESSTVSGNQTEEPETVEPAEESAGQNPASGPETAVSPKESIREDRRSEPEALPEESVSGNRVKDAEE